ncbi:MAG: hypothetical protein V8Q40_12480 [Anaerosacchariphilus sp.]
MQLTEQEPEADSAELPAFLDDKLIMAIISNKDDDLKYKKQQIELYFSIHPEEADRAEYLKIGLPGQIHGNSWWMECAWAISPRRTDF